MTLRNAFENVATESRQEVARVVTLVEVAELLAEILVQQKIMNMQLALLTDVNFEDYEVDE